MRAFIGVSICAYVELVLMLNFFLLGPRNQKNWLPSKVPNALQPWQSTPIFLVGRLLAAIQTAPKSARLSHPRPLLSLADMATASLAVRSAFGVALAALIAARAVRRRSLDASGGAAGFAVMALHLACGYRYGALLLAFFFTSSKVTKIGEDRKRRVEEDFKEGGQRNW